MHDPIPGSEIRHFEQLEEACDDGIPEWIDEDRHLHDFEADEMQQRIEEHYLEEYLELRGIGLEQ